MTLPDGWAVVTVADIADTKLGKMLDVAKNKGDFVPYLRNVNVRWGEFDLSDLFDMRVTPDEYSELAVQDGDLFVCEGGEPGRSAIWRGGPQHIVFQKALHRVRTRPGIEPDYLARHLKHAADTNALADLLTGSTIRHLPQVGLQKIQLNLPPTAEQRRIVTKLDTLTAHVARARAELQRATVLAENLRANVVVAAFRGELSARWRETNSSTIVASLKETDSAYAQVAGSPRRKPILSIDWKPNSSIPKSWRWASVDEVVALVQYGTSAKTSDDQGGVPVLRMGNIQRGTLDWSKLKYLPAAHGEFPSLFLADGDVLFNRTNSLELVGKSAVYQGRPEPASFASYLIRLRCSAVRPDLLARYLNSPIGRSWVGRFASQQVGQANVNGTKLRALGIPLPPMAEQVEISRLLDTAFARADRLEAEAARASALLDRLESAILAKAFRGELVPQDPNDEPASVLLDRIRAERAAAPKPKRGRRAAADA